jgi:FMN phosphatase YigB (HAD superfamily)
MAAIHALLFDVFGTLVDWRSSIAREAEATLAPRGVAVDRSRSRTPARPVPAGDGRRPQGACRSASSTRCTAQPDVILRTFALDDVDEATRALEPGLASTRRMA